MTDESSRPVTRRRPVPLPAAIKPQPRVIFSDVDDTLTWEGEMPAQTFAALSALRDAGFTVVPVTGASAGWCDCLIKTWPIAHIIGENGALSMEKNEAGIVNTIFYKQQSVIASDLSRLREIGDELTQTYPDIGYTQDQPFRLTDIAFDIGQTVRVPETTAIEATQWLQRRELKARRSSIHINVWLGNHSKATAAKAWLTQRNVDLSECVFVGDSPNDESMFEQIPLSVGVANVGRFLDSMTYAPTYITQSNGGHGFAELANALISDRSSAGELLIKDI